RAKRAPPPAGARASRVLARPHVPRDLAAAPASHRRLASSRPRARRPRYIMILGQRAAQGPPSMPTQLARSMTRSMAGPALGLAIVGAVAPGAPKMPSLHRPLAFFGKAAQENVLAVPQ